MHDQTSPSFAASNPVLEELFWRIYTGTDFNRARLAALAGWRELSGHFGEIWDDDGNLLVTPTH